MLYMSCELYVLDFLVGHKFEHSSLFLLSL